MAVPLLLRLLMAGGKAAAKSGGKKIKKAVKDTGREIKKSQRATEDFRVRRKMEKHFDHSFSKPEWTEVKKQAEMGFIGHQVRQHRMLKKASTPKAKDYINTNIKNTRTRYIRDMRDKTEIGTRAITKGRDVARMARNVARDTKSTVQKRIARRKKKK